MFRYLFIPLFLPSTIFCQPLILDLNNNWQFRKAGTTQWYKATVPGTIHTDLHQNKLIPEPFFRDNEKKLQLKRKTQ